MSTKPFKEIGDQISILELRGLNISKEDNVETILMRENYYNVINGYKLPFLRRDLDGEISSPEQFVEDCSFKEIYTLYKLDRDLRMHLLKYLLKFETHFKTSCAYNFSFLHRDEYAYLNIASYSKSKDDFEYVLKNISALSNEITRNAKKSLYIKHYVDKHDCVPLWVLVNSLTFGTINYFYLALEESLKNTIAKDFSIQHKKEYSSQEKIEMSEMQEVLRMINFIRNLCAHEEVLFNFKLHKGIKYSLFRKFFDDNIIKDEDLKISNLYTLVLLLKLVLPKEEYVELLDGIAMIFDEHEKFIVSVHFSEIIKLGGFKPSWRKDIVDQL